MPLRPRLGSRIREVFPNVTALLVIAVLMLAAGSVHAPVHAHDAFNVTEVAPGVFVHQGRYEIFTPRNSGDTSNNGFIIGRDGVAVIDTGGSPRVGEELLAAIRARTKLPIKYVINTHMHPDHVFGNVAFEAEKPVFVGHAKLRRALAARADRYLAINKELLGDAFEGERIIPPTELVKDRLELDLGDRKLLDRSARDRAHRQRRDRARREDRHDVPGRSSVLQARAGARRLDPRLAYAYRHVKGEAATSSSPCRGTAPHRCLGRRRSPPSSAISTRSPTMCAA